MPRVVMPLPDRDFDVTEVAVPWKVLSGAGVTVCFATETGETPEADRLLLGGLPPGLKARADAVACYRELERDAAFLRPLRWADLAPAAFDGLWLAGGHAPGMRQYLDAEVVRRFVAGFWARERPVAAICHGVLVLARTRSPDAERSVLWGKRTTCLPKYMEQSAYWLTAPVLGRYYRTYEAYVEDEVTGVLARPEDFERGPRTFVRRGSETSDEGTFVVRDGHYLSARWPGDAWALARALRDALGARSA